LNRKGAKRKPKKKNYIELTFGVETPQALECKKGARELGD